MRLWDPETPSKPNYPVCSLEISPLPDFALEKTQRHAKHTDVPAAKPGGVSANPVSSWERPHVASNEHVRASLGWGGGGSGKRGGHRAIHAQAPSIASTPCPTHPMAPPAPPGLEAAPKTKRNGHHRYLGTVGTEHGPPATREAPRRPPHAEPARKPPATPAVRREDASAPRVPPTLPPRTNRSTPSTASSP